VEDIHWAEPTLLDLIEHLADWTRDAPLCLLCLARPELLDERPAWVSGRANAELLTLAPLRDDEAEQLIDSLVDGSALEPEVHARIRAVAEGNPLFVEQLVAAVSEGRTAEGVPSTIQALLSARLDALSETERAVLERASVVGLEFEWEALARLAPDGHRPAGAVLTSLVRKELIGPDEAIEDSFRFRHMLIRDAAYERISKELRSELHERFADWLDGRGDEFDEIVGYHLEQAYRYQAELGPVPEHARDLARRAGRVLGSSARRAYDRGDARAAANLFERAIALLPTDDPARLRLLPAVGRALRDTGRMEDAESALAEAVGRAQVTGERLVDAEATVVLAEHRFHTVTAGRAEVVGDVESALTTFEEMGDKAGMAQALALRGKLAFWAGHAADAAKDVELSARLADEVGDRAQEAESLHYVLAAMHRGPMPAKDALARYDEMRPRVERNRRLQVTYLPTRAHLEAMQERFDVARALIAQGIALAEELGLKGVLHTHSRPAAGYVELLAGEAAAAEPELRASCEESERLGELGFLSSNVPLLVDAVLMQGRYDEALELTERWRAERLTVPEDVDAHAGWRRVRARALAHTGDLADAERLGREAVALLSATDYLDAHATAVADLGRVLSIAGRAEESAVTTAEAIRLFEQKGNVAAVRTLRGRAPAEAVARSAAAPDETAR
jgi:predicted ATPase